MKMVLLTIFALGLLLSTAVNSQVSLDDAVNKAKSEGTVLSAKTIDGHHEIKVLTPSGTVKTINQSVLSADNKLLDRPEYYRRGGESMRDSKQNTIIPDRFNNSKQNNRTRHSFNRSHNRNNNNNNRNINNSRNNNLRIDNKPNTNKPIRNKQKSNKDK